jgi:hypothetical protein
VLGGGGAWRDALACMRVCASQIQVVLAARAAAVEAKGAVDRYLDRQRGFTQAAGPHQTPSVRAVVTAGAPPLVQPKFDSDLNDAWRKRRLVSGGGRRCGE